jgi:O-antigen/teichoic acid export membrane protein
MYKLSGYAETFGKTFLKLLSVSFLILLCVTLFAPFLFNIKLFNVSLFDKSYEPGLIILPYILSGYLLNGIISFYSLYPFTSGKSYHFLISDGSAFIVNIILNLILIPVLGMLGAAVATTAAFLASALYLFFISGKKINIFYPLKEIITITLITLIVFIVGIVFKNVYWDILLICVYLVIVKKMLKIKITGLIKIA